MTKPDGMTPIPTVLTDKQNDLIRQAFKDDEDFLKSIRALFFGLSTTEEERTRIKNTFSGPDLLAVMWKKFCPTLDRTMPIGQVQDEWMGTEQNIIGQPEYVVQQVIKYREMCIEMTKAALKLLEHPELPAPVLDYEARLDNGQGVLLLARNQYIRHIETQLSLLRVVAQTDPPAKEAAKDGEKVIHRNSSK